MEIIIDNTVFSNFSSAGKIELIHILFEEVYASNEVHEEILNGIAAGYDYLKDIDKNIAFRNERGWIKVKNIESAKEHIFAEKARTKVHSAEASCIAIAKFRNLIFASDDREARKLAEKEGVKFTGTIGILNMCVKRGIISSVDADRVLVRMAANGYYSPVVSLEELG